MQWTKVEVEGAASEGGYKVQYPPLRAGTGGAAWRSGVFQLWGSFGSEPAVGCLRNIGKLGPLIRQLGEEVVV